MTTRTTIKTTCYTREGYLATIRKLNRVNRRYQVRRVVKLGTVVAWVILMAPLFPEK